MFRQRRLLRLLALPCAAAALAPAAAAGAGYAGNPHTAAQPRGSDSVAAPATTRSEPEVLVTATRTGSLGHGVHVTTTARVTSWAVTVQTNAWRTGASGGAHGAVAAYLVGLAGDVIDASDIHRFHTGWSPSWGGTGRAYTWTDPLPFATGLRAASVVICHGRTIAAVKRTCAWPWIRARP